MGKPDEEALVRFVQRRDAGDSAGAAKAWAEVVELLHDRIAQIVALQGRRSGVPTDEQEDVVQAVHMNAWDYARKFKGSSMGELHKSLKTMAHARCVDHVDARRRHRNDADSLDAAGWEQRADGEVDRRPHEGEVERAWEAHLHVEATGTVEEFLAWALPQMDGRQRFVWERDQAGVDPEAICVALRITKSNLYQLRRRGLLALQDLHREFFS